MMGGRPITVVLAIVILAMLGLTVLPAQQQRTAANAGSAAFSTLDYIEIQQLVRKYAWAIDSGDNYGYAYADLFTPDGSFVTPAAPGGEPKTYQGRDDLATVARGRTLGPTHQRHFTMNQVIKPTADGATGRAYVAVLDVGVVGKPNAVNQGGYFDDVYQKTAQGWRFKKRTFVPSKVDIVPPATPAPGK